MLTKIKTITYLKIIIVVLSLLVICLFINNNLINKQTKIENYSRYVLTPEYYAKKEKSESNLMIATNYQEYQAIIKHYEITNSSVDEADFNKNNYAFILLSNHYLCDSDILRSHSYNDEKITFYFSQKYLCYLSNLGDIVYEVPLSKKVNSNSNTQIRYIDNLNTFINIP